MIATLFLPKKVCSKKNQTTNIHIYFLLRSESKTKRLSKTDMYAKINTYQLRLND